MQLTTNLNLKKPEITDNVNIEDLNGNADILDAEVTKLASTTEAGRMSAADKTKLAGIEAGAQANTVASVAGKTGAVTLAKADVGLGNVDNVQQAPISHVGSGGSAHAAATTSAAGFMSAADKTKLDGIASGAQVNRTLASQAQAEAGTDNVTDMTPLRTAQAIAAMAPIDHVDVWLGTTGGSGTAYTTTGNSKLTAYAAGQRLSFQAHAASGTNPTLKPGTLAALPIRKPNGTAAKLDSGGIYTVIVNIGVTAFILQGEGGEYGTAVSADVLFGKTIGTPSGLVTGIMPNYTSQNRAAMPPWNTGTRLYFPISEGGFYEGGGGSGVYVDDADFLPSNIRQGANLFGVAGTLVEGKRVAYVANTASFGDNGVLSFAGIGFTPAQVYLLVDVSVKGQGTYNGVASRHTVILSTGSMLTRTSYSLLDTSDNFYGGYFSSGYLEIISVNWGATTSLTMRKTMNQPTQSSGTTIQTFTTNVVGALFIS